MFLDGLWWRLPTQPDGRVGGLVCLLMCSVTIIRASTVATCMTWWLRACPALAEKPNSASSTHGRQADSCLHLQLLGPNASGLRSYLSSCEGAHTHSHTQNIFKEKYELGAEAIKLRYFQVASFCRKPRPFLGVFVEGWHWSGSLLEGRLREVGWEAFYMMMQCIIISFHSPLFIA